MAKRLIRVALALSIAALCGCAGGGGGQTGRGPIQATEPPAPAAASPSSPFTGIASPAELARQSSAATPLRGARGADFEAALGSSRCAADGRYAVFTPDFSSGAANRSGLAFAIYRFDLSGFADQKELSWDSEDGSALDNCWLGLSNFHSNRWQWFASTDPELKDLTPISRFMNPANGETFVAVVVTGTQEQKLKYLRVGGDLPPVAALTATPDYGVLPLDVHLDASQSYDIDGEVATYSFWSDFAEKSPPSPLPTYDLVVDGSQTVYVSILDGVNIPAQAQAELAICNPGFFVYPSSGRAELPAHLSVYPNLASGEIVSCEFDPDGDGTFDLASPDFGANYVYSASGEYQAAVRLVDDSGRAYLDTWTVHVDPDDGQPRWRAVKHASPATHSPMLALVGGRPAICSYRSGQLVYQRANNTLGTLWGSARVVAEDASNGYGVLSMAEVAELPAVLYIRSNGTAYSLCYRRAADLDGTSWSEESVVRVWDEGGWVFASLLDVGGNPAVASINMGFEGPEYVRALDPDAAAWGSPVSLWLLGASGISMAMVNGAPAISFAYGGIYYTRANDALGLTWPAPQFIGTSVDGSWYQSLALLNGKPAVAYCSTGEGGIDGEQEALILVRSADANGANWLPQQTLDSGFDACGRYPSLRSINGVPSVSYWRHSLAGDPTDGNAILSALDPDGVSWAAPLQLGSFGFGYTTLAEPVSGCPAVACEDSSSVASLYWVYY